MAMKGRPLAKQGYEQELSSIRAFVSMQNKTDGNSSASASNHGVSFILTHSYSNQSPIAVIPVVLCVYMYMYIQEVIDPVSRCVWLRCAHCTMCVYRRS